MRIILFLILLFFGTSLIDAQGNDPVAGKSNSKKSSVFAKKTSSKPKANNNPKAKKSLFSKKQKANVPAGYGLDNRKPAATGVTENPNAKQMIPKGQQKRMAAKKKAGFLKKKKTP